MSIENPESLSNYTTILQEELVPAIGCTESITTAYTVAKAKKLLEEEPLHITVDCPGNIIENVKGVTVPNSGGQKGVKVAATLDTTGGQADKKLEVISAADDSARACYRELINAGPYEVDFAEDVPNLYIAAKVRGNTHTVEVVIVGHHTNTARMVYGGVTVFEQAGTATHPENVAPSGVDRSKMTLRGLLDYAVRVDLSEASEFLGRQTRYNRAISQEGLGNGWGVRIGKTMLEGWGGGVKTRAIVWAAVGPDARVSGYTLSVVISSGSGNQDITVTLPVLVYAEEPQASKQKLYRALPVSNLVSIYIKHFIGPLSALCGAVSATCGAGIAITYMAGGNEKRTACTITNTLGNVDDIIYGGTKSSCAARVASSVHAAILVYQMNMRGQQFQPGEGIIEKGVEETIRNIGCIDKVGMKSTDHEILDVVIGKVDVNACV